MTDDKLKHYDIIDTEDEGNCAIHSVLYGLQRVYTNKQIVDILNQYLEQQISKVVLEEEKPKIRYSTDTTNAVRQALYNYYNTNKNDLHSDLMTPDTDPSKFTAKNREEFKKLGVNIILSNNSTNELPHYKNIIKDKVWLTDVDLYYICKLFDICIKLQYRNPSGKQEYLWKYINPEIDKYSIEINTFEQQCEKVIYIQFVNGNHFRALILKGSKSKRPVQNSYNKTAKRRISPLKRKYYNKTSKFQYPSNHTIAPTQPKSNNIILGGLALVGIGVGVLVAMS